MAETVGTPVARSRSGRWPASLRVGAGMVVVLVLLAALARLLAPYNPDQMNLLARFAKPGAAHWFGCDEYGRDVLSRVLYRAKLSLSMGGWQPRSASASACRSVFWPDTGAAPSTNG